MAMVAIVAIASGVYGISENSPVMIREGHSQLADRTFDERVAANHLTIVGEIIGSEVEMFEETITGTDCDGCEEYVIEKTTKPKAKITVKVTEVLKDDGILNGEKTVTFYDSHFTGIGKVNDAPTKFVSQNAIDYRVGDKGIFIINEDRGLNMMGFTHYYPIKDGVSKVTSEFDTMTEKTPIDVENAKEIAKSIAQRTQ